MVERAPTAAEQDTQWRARMKPDAPPAPAPPAAQSPALSAREESNPPSPAGPPAAPATRPKLQLQKRTVSETAPEAATSTSGDAKASPFGAARPIDTAAREKAVEEKRQIAIREKKEAEDKARAEKKIAEDKVKEEKKLGKEVEENNNKTQQQVQSPREKPNGHKLDKQEKREKPEKENGVSAPAPGKQYEILRRHVGDDASTVDEETEDLDEADQNGKIIDDKEVKPKEIVRDAPSANAGQAETSTEATAAVLEEDGWNVVPEKRRKNGNAASRALAS